MHGTLRTNPNQNYTFMEMANLSWDMLKEEWRDRGPTQHFMSDFMDDVSLYSRLTQDNVIGIVLVTFLFTVHRWIFTRLILNVSIILFTFFREGGTTNLTTTTLLAMHSAAFIRLDWNTQDIVMRICK